MKRKVALISEHASPFTVLDSMDRGGHTVYVAEVAQHLARQGYLVDVFTRKDSQELPEIYDWYDNLRVIHVPAGPSEHVREEALARYLKDFSAYLIEFFGKQEKPYDLVHANFWRSGWVAAEIKANFGTPFVITFHTLGRLWQQRPTDKHPSLQRFDVETRVVHEADGIIAKTPQDQHDLVSLYDADPAYIAQIPGSFDVEEVDVEEKSDGAAHEVPLYKGLFDFREATSLLTDFYENVLAVRRVTLPDVAEFLLAMNSGQTPLSVVEPNSEWDIQTRRATQLRLGEGLLEAAVLMIDCLGRGGKIMIGSDDGSAAAARQFASGLANCLVSAHQASLPVLLLADRAVDAAGPVRPLADQVEELGQHGDVLIGIAASDGTADMVQTFQCARANGIHCISLQHNDGSRLSSVSDVSLFIPASGMEITDESYLLVLRLLCELVRAHVPVRQVPSQHLHEAQRA